MTTAVFMTLLIRLQGTKTDKFAQGFLRFICFACAINKDGLDPDGVIAMLDGCQPQPGSAFFASAVREQRTDAISEFRLFAQVLPVLLPEVQKAPTKDRKIIAVGLANILSRSRTMLVAPSVAAW